MRRIALARLSALAVDKLPPYAYLWTNQRRLQAQSGRLP